MSKKTWLKKSESVNPHEPSFWWNALLLLAVHRLQIQHPVHRDMMIHGMHTERYSDYAEKELAAFLSDKRSRKAAAKALDHILVMRHENISAILTFLATIPWLPWNKHHAFLLMQTEATDMAALCTHIPLDWKMVNEALSKTDYGTGLTIDLVRLYSIRGVQRIRGQSLFERFIRFALNCSISVHPELLPHKWVHYLLSGNPDQIPRSAVFALSEKRQEALSDMFHKDYFTLLHLWRVFGTDREMLQSLIGCMTEYHWGDLFLMSTAEEATPEMLEVFCQSARLLTDNEVIYLGKRMDNDPLWGMISQNKFIQWSDNLVSNFIENIPNKDIAQKARDFFERELGFFLDEKDDVSQEENQEKNQRDLMHKIIDDIEKGRESSPVIHRIVDDFDYAKEMDALLVPYASSNDEEDALCGLSKLVAEEKYPLKSDFSHKSISIVSGRWGNSGDHWSTLAKEITQKNFQLGGSSLPFDETSSNHPEKAAYYLGFMETKMEVSGFYEEFPHFSKVTRILMGHVLSSLLANRPIHFDPVLLLGDAGIGKTSYLHRFCEIWELPMDHIDMGVITGGFVLTGSSEEWRGAKPGRIAQYFLENKNAVANPVFLLDEIDKGIGSERFPLYPSLLSLLEKGTAQNFQDEYLYGLNFDLRHASFVMTANDIHGIPQSFLSRVLVMEVSPPSVSQKKEMAQKMYQRLLKKMGVSSFFAERLPSVVVDAVLSGSLRDMDRDITLAVNQSLLRIGVSHNIEVTMHDLQISATQKRIGF